jgi:hypothetical protein
VMWLATRTINPQCLKGAQLPAIKHPAYGIGGAARSKRVDVFIKPPRRLSTNTQLWDLHQYEYIDLYH